MSTVVGALFLARSLWSTSAEQLLVEAKQALTRGDFVEAERLAKRCLKKKSGSVACRLVAGQAAEKLGRREDALAYVQTVELDGSPESFECVSLSGKLLVQLGQAASAEERWRGLLEQDPHHFETHLGLAFLLRLQGRNWELRPNVLELLRSLLLASDKNHAFDVKSLVYPLRSVGNTEWVWLEPQEKEFVNVCRATVPNDFLPALGEARIAAANNAVAQAGRTFVKIVSANPEQIEAQAQLGLLLANVGSESDFQTWSAGLPQSASGHPEIWVARGIFSRRHEKPETAARCFWEALRLHPNHLRANYQLSQLLVSLGRRQEARPFAERAEELSRLEYLIKDVGSEPDRIPEVAAMMETLGREWEAAAWYRIGVEIFPHEDWAKDGLRNTVASLTADTPLTRESANPATQIDLSEYSLPDWEGITSDPREEIPTRDAGNVSWENLADAAGLRFSYNNGRTPEVDGAYMFEFSGGGIAILDYDGDAWPDVYLTQGGTWPPEDNQTNGNRLFHNLGNGRFEDVTAQAGVAGSDFSQGVTVGDYNNDGFPDLYVANIGPNRFYENNGDGTFSDVSLLAGTAGQAWTLSCVLADFNGDSLPDLYTVNYLGGPEVFQRICTKQGRAVQCLPTMFPAEQDQLYQNLNDGSFKNVTAESGIVARDGKGMGIVVADFSGSHRLDLFVANDTTANFFFVNETDSAGASLSFAEEGLLRGLALDENGRALSCMGIAAGDATGNGLVDLFVTNFSREANSLYLHQSDHTFVDTSRQAKLRDSGFHLMGWGTQFLDGELDGLLDLVVANGDLEDLSDVGVSSRMPLIYYANIGRDRFVPIPATQLGPHFQRMSLGRAIATLDWNRDGLDDFCMTSVDAPVALMTNRTSERGHFLAVTLRGVQSSRDAIGTVVRVKFGEQSLTRQLTAGDGFQASNQRKLVFGLGNNNQIDELTVFWPAGTEQTFKKLQADQELILVEGYSRPHRLKPD